MSKTDLLRRLLRDERGATAIEYGLVLAMITLAVMGALKVFASETVKIWNDFSTKSVSAMNGS